MTLRNLQRRVQRLAQAASRTDQTPSWIKRDEKRVLSHPEGPALMAELAAMRERIFRDYLARNPQMPAGANAWPVHCQQQLIQDARGREILCRLSELRGGLPDLDSEGNLLPFPGGGEGGEGGGPEGPGLASPAT